MFTNGYSQSPQEPVQITALAPDTLRREEEPNKWWRAQSLDLDGLFYGGGADHAGAAMPHSPQKPRRNA